MIRVPTLSYILRSALLGVALGAACFAGPAAAEPYMIISAFDSDADGWGIVNDGNGPTWVATGGHEGGYISATDRGLGTWWYFRAPAKFLGNRAAAYGQWLTFFLRQSLTDNQDTTQPDVILVGGGYTLAHATPNNPGTTWTPYAIRLDETAPWTHLGSGMLATPVEMQTVLANLAELRIRGEYRSGADTGGLDSVAMTLSEPPPPTTLPVTSTFDLDDEGWTIVGDAQGSSNVPDYVPTDGNPGGHVSARDDVTGGVWYWNAPSRFLGDLSGAYGHTLSFDLKQSSLNSQFNAPDIVLTGSVTLVYDTPNNPGTDWTRYTVPLGEGAGWRLGSLNGAPATEADIRAALAYLFSLRIRGEFVTGPDTGGLDNVVLGGTPSLWGDANGNGIVEWGDVAAALGAGGGLRSDGNVERGDVAPMLEAGFGDDHLTILDAIRIARYLNGLEPAFP